MSGSQLQISGLPSMMASFLFKMIMERKNKKNNTTKYVVYILLIGCLLTSVIYSFFLPKLQYMFVSDEVIELSSKWEKTSSTTAEYQIPNDIYDGTLKLVTSWYEMDIYVDDELILSYCDDNGQSCMDTIMIQLPNDCEGKTLKLICFDGEDALDQLLEKNSYIGNSIAVLLHLFCDNLDTIVYIFFGVGCAIVVAIICLFSRMMITSNITSTFIYLLLFNIFASIWIFTDSEIPSVFITRGNVVAILNYLSLSQLPITMLLFLQGFLQEKHLSLKLLTLISEMIIVVNVVLWTIFQTPLFESLYLIHICIVLAIIFAIYHVIQELRAFHDDRLRYILRGIAFLVVSAIPTIFSYYKDPSGNYAIYYCIGMFMFSFCIAIPAFLRAVDSLTKSMKNKVYQQMAYHDILTGLYNRNAFEERIRQWENSQWRGMILFDINDLKKVNDLYGHVCGDQLIMNAAKCISSSFKNLGPCFRIGGDEFVVLLEETSITQIEEQICKFLEEEASIAMIGEIPLEIAWGYSYDAEGTHTYYELEEIADTRMYQCKSDRKQNRKNQKING